MPVEPANVYRDNERINSAPVTGTEFVDNVSDPENHSWVVTAVYDQGESGASNVAKAETSSLEDALAGNIAIKAVDGMIVVTGCEGIAVTVASVDGKLIYNAPGSAITEISVGAGVYVVKAGQTVCKLVVKD